jgi:hypothetical protein
MAASRLYSSPPQYAQSPSYIRQDMPVYRLRSACYFQDRYLDGGTVISLHETAAPNLEMFPLNELAYKQYVSFLKVYDENGVKWSEKTNMAYVPKVPAFLTEWANVNALAKQRGIPLERAAAVPAPIMVKAPTAPMFELVDMTIAPQMPIEVGAPVKATA